MLKHLGARLGRRGHAAFLPRAWRCLAAFVATPVAHGALLAAEHRTCWPCKLEATVASIVDAYAMASFSFLRECWGIELEERAAQEITESLESLTKKEIQEYIKDTDIRKFGLSTGLPKELARSTESALPPGKYLVQVQKIADITQPSKFQEEFEGGKWRLLVLDLAADGQKFRALEYGSVKPLGVHLPPGTKLLLWSESRAPLRMQNGHLLLTQDNVEVLGGSVEKLVESWRATKDVEANRLLWRTEGIKKKVDGEGAPCWVDFDPKKVKRGRDANADKQAIEQERKEWLRGGSNASAQNTIGSKHAQEGEKEARFQVSDFASPDGEGAAAVVKSQVSSSAFKQQEKGGKGKGKSREGGGPRGRKGEDWDGEEKRAPTAATSSLISFIKPTKKTGEVSEEAAAFLAEAAADPGESWYAEDWGEGDWDASAWGASDWSQNGWGSSSWSGGGGGYGGGKSRKGGKGGGKGKGARKGGSGYKGSRR